MPRRTTMFDINKYCENVFCNKESNIQYLKKATAGNDPTITKAMRYAEYVRRTPPHVVGKSINVALTQLQQFIYGDVDTVRSLLNSVNIDEYDSFGWNALSRAAYDGDLEKINLLLDAGANINTTDSSGANPTYWAKVRNRVDLFYYLRSRGGIFL